MLPTAYPYDRQALFDAWRQFVEDGACDPDTMDPAVTRSWQRCRQAGVIPHRPIPALFRLSAEELEPRLHAHFDLIAIARPFMEDIYRFVGERDAVVFLTDRDLCVLDAEGDRAMRAWLGERGFDNGVLLSEDRVGTNAASLASSEGIASQVVGREHYCDTFQVLTDTAAPVHAPQGEMLGVLGIVTPERDSHPHTLAIVMAAARAIENQLQADLSLLEANRHLERVAELDLALEALNKGILLLDHQGRVTHINARASEILGISQRFAMGRELGSLLTVPPVLEAAMAQGTPVADREVVFQVSAGLRPCLLSMEVLRQGPHLGGFAFRLEHPADVRQLVHRMVGAKAHFTFDDIVGQDAEMRRVLHYARSIAASETNVLLVGESGSRKELFAEAIHSASRRAKGPFIGINCAAIPRELTAIELFGYEGAFIGSGDEAHPGKLELADGGTVCLYNVEALPIDAQAGLLRIIDAREVVRLGGTRVVPVDVRVVATTTSDLAEQMRRARFRADLFYRLNVLTLTIPPLRERVSDIPLLATRVVERLGRDMGKSVSISAGAMAVLQAYQWPGNVRELESALEQAMHMVEGGELSVEHLPRELCMGSSGGTGERVISLQEAERQAILRAGRALGGNTTKMAQLLGIGRTTLWRKMRAFQMSPESFKSR